MITVNATFVQSACYSLRSDTILSPETIKSFCHRFSSYKTPTCVLVDPNERFKAFGYDAQQQYAALVDNQDRTHAFFERFKMKLHNNKVRFVHVDTYIMMFYLK